MSDVTQAERYGLTISRLEQITRAGYHVKITWECEFDDACIVDQKPEMLTHHIISQIPLCARDSLYGGRTEAMRLHYKVQEDEAIQYVDVTILYPYICKYFKFPFVHPLIHVGNVYIDKEACLRV